MPELNKIIHRYPVEIPVFLRGIVPPGFDEDPGVLKNISLIGYSDLPEILFISSYPPVECGIAKFVLSFIAARDEKELFICNGSIILV